MTLCTCGHNSKGWELATKLQKQLSALETAIVVIAHMDPADGKELAAEANDALAKLKTLREGL